MDIQANFVKEYNEVQCDKRNTYRRKVKEEKAAAAAVVDGDDISKDGNPMEATNGIVNGHDGADDEDRPAKKLKAEDGSAIAPDVDGLEDDDMHDDQDDEQEVYEHQEEDEDEDDIDDVDDEDDEDEGPSAVLVDDAEANEMAASRMQLQEPDSELNSDSD